MLVDGFRSQARFNPTPVTKPAVPADHGVEPDFQGATANIQRSESRDTFERVRSPGALNAAANMRVNDALRGSKIIDGRYSENLRDVQVGPRNDGIVKNTLNAAYAIDDVTY